jgi:RNA polymerase sigma-70 factor (ECF subfamily)
MVKDSDLAEDLVQETLIKAWLGLKKNQYDNKLGTPVTWALIVARNLTLDYLRRSKNNKQNRVPYELLCNVLQDDNLDQIDRLHCEQVVLTLKKIVKKLTPQQRLIFHYRFVEQMRYEDVNCITLRGQSRKIRQFISKKLNLTNIRD